MNTMKENEELHLRRRENFNRGGNKAEEVEEGLLGRKEKELTEPSSLTKENPRFNHDVNMILNPSLCLLVQL